MPEPTIPPPYLDARTELPCQDCIHDDNPYGRRRCSLCGLWLCVSCWTLHHAERQVAHMRHPDLDDPDAARLRERDSLCRYVEALGQPVGVVAVLARQEAIVEWWNRYHARQQAQQLRDRLRPEDAPDTEDEA